MKRIHLFEFEDQAWFPSLWRDSMTKLINVLHGLFKSHGTLATILEKALAKTGDKNIVDLCSGSGGTMPDVLKLLKQQPQLGDVQLTLSDLYPSKKIAETINEAESAIHYYTKAVDASKVPADLKGFRTMVCSFHHMKPDVAKNILRNAKDDKEGILIFEISDNRYPNIMSATAFPINIISSLFLTLFSKPSLGQLFFTYLVPIIPICFAWDGAVSNVRTYTMADLDILLEGLQDDTYVWEKGIAKGKSNMPYLIGYPQKK